MPRWIAIVDLPRAAALVSGPKTALDRFETGPGDDALLGDDVEVEPLTSLDEHWDAPWLAMAAAGSTGTWRDAAYLRWRYLEHLVFTYRVLGASRRGEPVGLLVLRVEQIQGRNETIVRFVDLIGPDFAVAALARAALAEARSLGACFADCYVTGSCSGLRSAGFVAVDAGDDPLPSRFRPLVAVSRPLAGAVWIEPGRRKAGPVLDGSLVMTKGDGDMDRP